MDKKNPLNRSGRCMAHTCILVMGLHRGGTSAVAGVLHRLGVDMNPTSGSLPGNTHEDVNLQLAHEEAIGDWKNPQPNFDLIRDQYTYLIREREKKPLWGFKDPRLCFLLPDILGVLNATPKVIYVYRRVINAANGLTRVNDLSFQEAMDIALKYSDAGVKAFNRFKGHKFVVFYDELVEHPTKVVWEIATFVGLSSNEKAIDFVDPELRHK